MRSQPPSTKMQRECGGSQICEHDRIGSQCKQCLGSAICPRKRIKSRCRECGFVSIQRSGWQGPLKAGLFFREGPETRRSLFIQRMFFKGIDTNRSLPIH